MDGSAATGNNQDVLAIGLLNAYNRSTACLSAIQNVSSKSSNWVLGLNEPNLRDLSEVIVGLKKRIFQSGSKGRALIIADPRDWKLLWAPAEAELVAIKGRIGTHNLIITCIYLSPTRNTRELEQERKIVMAYHEMVRNNLDHQHILIGDINAEHWLWGANCSDKKGDMIYNSVHHLGFESAIKRNKDNWTRKDKNSGRERWIDICLVNHKLGKLITSSDTVDVPESDHRQLCFTISTNTKERKVTNWNKVKEEMKKADFSFLKQEINSLKDSERIFILFESKLRMIAQAGRERRVSKKNSVSTELLSSKRVLSRRIRRMNKRISKADDASKVILLKYRETLQKELGKCKNQMKKNVKRAKRCISQKKNLSRWTIINGIMGKKFLKEMRGNLENIPCEKTIEMSLDEASADYKDEMILFEEDKKPSINYPLNLTDKDKKKIIQDIASKTCQFDEDLSCRLLAIAIEHHKNSIFTLIENSLSKGFIPAFIKKAKTSFIPKACGKKLRPLSILHPIYRLIDATMLILLTRFIDYKRFTTQFGFIPNCGIIDYHIELKRYYNKVQQTRNPYMLVSIDLSNAFEEINYQAIMQGLNEFKVPQEVKILILRLLTDRQSCVIHEGAKKWKTHKHGTPQGGFCSPLLFIIGLKLIDVFNNKDFKILCYADDMIIIIKGDMIYKWTRASKKLQNLITALERMNLKINIQKTQTILFWHCGLKKNNIQTSITNLEINGEWIKVKPKIKVVGIEFQTKVIEDENKNECIRTIECVDSLTTEMTTLLCKLYPFAKRLQTLKINDCHLLLSSLINGKTNFYGVIYRIWHKWPEFKKICDETSTIIGNIMVMAWDLRRQSNRQILADFFTRCPLHVSIHKICVDYMMRIDRTKNPREMVKLDYPDYESCKIKIIKQHPTMYNPCPNDDIKYLGKRSTRDLKVISISRKREDISQWIEWTIWQDGKPTISSITRYWTTNDSYLDIAIEHVYDCLVSNLNILIGESLAMEIDLGLQKRIMKPIKMHGLYPLIQANFKTVYFIKRVKRELVLPRNKEHKFTLSENTIQFWKFMKAKEFDLKAKESKTITAKMLYENQMKAIQWEQLRRTDLFSLIFLLGGYHYIVSEPTCSTCQKPLNAEGLILGICEHYPPLQYGKRTITHDNAHLFFGHLSKIRKISHMVRTRLKEMSDLQPNNE